MTMLSWSPTTTVFLTVRFAICGPISVVAITSSIFRSISQADFVVRTDVRRDLEV